MDIKPVSLTAPVNPATEMPAIPKDAQYTIFCRAFAEETHVEDSRRAQQELHDTTKMKTWYVVHANDHSTLYYGFYSCIDPRDKKNAAEGQRAINELNMVRAMSTQEGYRLFPESLLVGIDSPDPQAKKEWDITQSKGTWSIEIASFTGASRKQDAVDSVKQARAQGVEAYYYHGETASSVCIGSWPAESAVETTPDVQNADPDKPLVVTNQPLADHIAKPLQQNGINTVSTQVDILDPTLTEAMHKWKEHATDGWTKPDEKSFLFRIPHKDPLDILATPDMTAPGPAAPAHAPEQGSNDGQLRALPQ